MITSAIEAHEEQDVAIIDIPGEFLHVHIDELIYMLLRGPLVEDWANHDHQLSKGAT